MKNHFIVSILVVVVAVVLGVTITVQKTNDPIMHRLLVQQNEVLDLQKNLQRQLKNLASQPAVKQVASAAAPVGTDLSAILSKQQDIEQRLAALETKLQPLFEAMKNAQRQGPGGGPQAPSDEYTKVHQIDIGSTPIKGKKDAPVTIVEFTDFQCPYCSRFHPVVEEVLAAYPDKVNFVLKNFPLPFHPQAKPAAKAALAAGEQGKYYEMVELLFKNNQQLSDAKYPELAKEIGLDVNKFTDDLKNKDSLWEEKIKADTDMAQKVEVRGTPTYFINGRKTMARDLDTYKKEIDEILKKK